MTDEMNLKTAERTEFGTRPSKRMRKAGLVPATVSHKSDKPVHLTVSDHDFQGILDKGGRIVALEGSGKAFIKEVQWDHLGDKILHVDFTKVALDEKLQMEVELVLKGIPVGVKDEGGTLDQFVKELKIECLPDSIPKKVVVDVTGMNKNEPLHLSDIPVIEGVVFLQEGALVLANVTEHHAEEEETSEVTPGAAEPERIEKEKTEDTDAK